MEENNIISGASIGGWNNRRKIRINNFRSIKMEDFIDIKKITLLFGRNGSGKSSFIKAIKFLGQNIFPIRSDQTTFQLDYDINLGDFDQIINNNDTSKVMNIDYEEYWEEYNISDDERSSIIFNYRLVTEISDNKEGKNISLLKIIDLKNNNTFEIFPHQQNPYDKNLVLNILRNREMSLSTEQLLDALDDKKIRLGNSSVPDKYIEIDRKLSLKISETFDQFIRHLDTLPFLNHSSDLQWSYFSKLSNYLGLNEQERKVANYILNNFVINIPIRAKKLFNHYYVTPVREKPLSQYRLIKNNFNEKDYYGIPNQVDRRNSIFNEYDSDNIFPDILEFINSNLLKLGLAQEFILKKNKGFGSIWIKDLNGIEHNLAESSSGLIQIIPIIVASFNALYDYRDFISLFDREDTTDVIVIEQPELHLHPSLQTKLVEFMGESMGTYIIETHSEHIVRKLQVLIAQGKLNKNRVAVYYFDKDEKSGITSIKEMELEDNGFFKEPWPDGFFDDSYNLARELIYARKN